MVALEVKNPPASAGDMRAADSISESGRSLEEETATHSGILAQRIPWSQMWLKQLSTPAPRWTGHLIQAAEGVGHLSVGGREELTQPEAFLMPGDPS